MRCDWCGGQHDVRHLCHGRPRWTRRGFLVLTGLGLAGCAAPWVPRRARPVVIVVSGTLQSDRVPGIVVADLIERLVVQWQAGTLAHGQITDEAIVQTLRIGDGS
jgi:hypothetical protein